LRKLVRAFREVLWTSELCVPVDLWAIGLPTSLVVICFRIRRGFVNQPSPVSCESGSFSPVRGPLRSSFATPSGHSFRRSLSCLGFLPSSRHDRERPLVRENALSRYVPSSGFCSLSTACSASGLVGLLHPTATSRVLSVQGFLSTRSRPDSSPGCSPMLLPRRPLTVLGRLPQSAGSASRFCSANRSVLRGRWLAFLSVAPLFGFPPPPGSGSSPWAQFPGSIRS
jgi:hypothetical protein